MHLLQAWISKSNIKQEFEYLHIFTKTALQFLIWYWSLSVVHESSFLSLSSSSDSTVKYQGQSLVQSLSPQLFKHVGSLIRRQIRIQIKLFNTFNLIFIQLGINIWMLLRDFIAV